MDINTIRAVLTIILIIAFLGLVAWAWSSKRKETFDKLSQMPLEEDDGQAPENKSRSESC
ncbi:MAG: cbb3-type cytochrome c oxidase subunit 3 [Xanthomonadales bacterium]